MAFSEHRADDMLLLQSEALSRCDGISHGFSTRAGGVSGGTFSSLNLGYRRGDDPKNVDENFRRFCAAAGMDALGLVCSSQVHGDAVRLVDARDTGWNYETPPPQAADAMITTTPGVTLAVFSADCIPILLCDPVRRAVGAVHAGWRGTALGLAEKAVSEMVRVFGCDPGRMTAAVGAGISPCCFETDGDVPSAMSAALARDAEPYLIRNSQKWRVDLKGINALFLRRAGIPAERIDIAPHCTACRPDLFWSHRRAGDKRGSQAALISLI